MSNVTRVMVRRGFFLAIAIAASDNRNRMATYSYILCSKCGGTSKAVGGDCPQCAGARMVGALVSEDLYQSFEVSPAADLLSELRG
jgi:hypothetical protein